MGTLLQRILLATDFSPGASRAQDYARSLAHTYGAALRIIHVSQPYPMLSADAVAQPYLLDPMRTEISRFLNELTGQLSKDGLQATSTHAVGIPSEQIIQAAQEDGTELIVVGTQGRTGLEHVLLGSTAERVVKGAPCPVLTVRSTLPPGPVKIERLVLPLDFSDCSLDALEFGIQVARCFQASVTLLHVLEWASLRLYFTINELAEGDAAEKTIASALSQYADLIREQGLIVDTVLRGGGGPTDLILETATEQHADLIVMGTHGRRGVKRALMGSVAEGTLRQAPCPVMTVKSPKFAPGHRRVLPGMEQQIRS